MKSLSKRELTEEDTETENTPIRNHFPHCKTEGNFQKQEEEPRHPQISLRHVFFLPDSPGVFRKAW